MNDSEVLNPRTHNEASADSTAACSPPGGNEVLSDFAAPVTGELIPFGIDQLSQAVQQVGKKAVGGVTPAATMPFGADLMTPVDITTARASNSTCVVIEGGTWWRRKDDA